MLTCDIPKVLSGLFFCLIDFQYEKHWTHENDHQQNLMSRLVVSVKSDSYLGGLCFFTVVL